MTETPPKRLLDDPATPPAMLADLETARDAEGLGYDTAAGLVAFSAALDAAAAGGSVGGAAATAGATAGTKGASAAASLWVSAKFWGLATVGLAGAGAAWVGTQAVREPAQTVSEAAPAASARPAPAREPQPSLPPTTSPASAADEPATEAAGHESSALPRDEPSVGRAPAPRKTPFAARTTSAPPVADTDTSAVRAPRVDPEEVAHLARVRESLPSRPAEALALAQRGQERFAGGMFEQERAAMVVFALEALGRDADARAEAERFLRAHPNGPFAARVRELRESIERGTR